MISKIRNIDNIFNHMFTEWFIGRFSKIVRNEYTSQEEAQIDLMVYKLYELTYDEVLIVEPDFAMSREEYEQFELEG